MALTKINPAQLASETVTPGSYTAPTVVVNLQGIVTSIASTTPLYKRRCAITFRPSTPTTADTVPDLSQETRLPLGSANAVSNWKAMRATLRTGVPNASATTVQLYYAPSANAVFGSGTAILSTALTESGTSSVEISTTAFTGTLATTGLAGGSILAPMFSALGGTKVSIEIEFEES